MTTPAQLPGNPASAPVTDPSTPAISRDTVIATANAATARNAKSTSEARIGPMMRRQRVRFHSHSAASVAFRCHQLFGESAQTWEQRLSGDYKRIALMNGVMRMMGALDLLTEKMMPVELSLGPEGVLPLPDALHEAELADCREQEADESFRHKLSLGTATIADAESYLKVSAMQCARAEVSRREVHRWIEAQKGER